MSKSQSVYVVFAFSLSVATLILNLRQEEKGEISKMDLSQENGDGTDQNANGLLGLTSATSHQHVPVDLSTMFEKVHSDPDVKPVKGAYKILSAIQSLGHLPDLSLSPNRKRASAVERVARSVLQDKTSFTTTSLPAHGLLPPKFFHPPSPPTTPHSNPWLPCHSPQAAWR